MYQNNRVRQSKPQTAKTPKAIFVVIGLILVALLAGMFFLMKPGSNDDTNTDQPTNKQTASFNKKQFSLDDPTSPWVVINKKRALDPIRYAPADLTAPDMQLAGSDTADNMQVNAQTASALSELNAAAKADGVRLVLASGYRSYDTQVAVYNSEVKGFGQAQADRESARPGHSEHQTGWAADLAAASGECKIESCFADTNEGIWLAANAYKYGFIIRYTEDKTGITGYKYEPWHVRYIGKDLAAEMHRTGVKTLEEFFGLPAAPDY